MLVIKFTGFLAVCRNESICIVMINCVWILFIVHLYILRAIQACQNIFASVQHLDAN